VPWSAPPSDDRLGPDEVQVWRAALDVDPDTRAHLRSVLTDDERTRADRFVQPVHRERFVVAHAFLRDVVARQAGVLPGSLHFRTLAAGKPVLDGSRLRFNLSHSGGLALLAVTLDREVGVDVEALRPMPDACELAERHFAPGEIAALRALPERDRDEAFLRCWTLKEAYVKAVGDGLGIPLERFEVEYAPPRAEPALRILDDVAPRPWTMRTLEPGPGYAGALAVLGSGFRLGLYDWTP
jgi:4'-phosphopantetheinyl transferase